MQSSTQLIHGNIGDISGLPQRHIQNGSNFTEAYTLTPQSETLLFLLAQPRDGIHHAVVAVFFKDRRFSIYFRVCHLLLPLLPHSSRNRDFLTAMPVTVYCEIASTGEQPAKEIVGRILLLWSIQCAEKYLLRDVFGFDKIHAIFH